MLSKRKTKKVKILCMDGLGKLIYAVELHDLQLKEDFILRTSKEEYQNDEPCIIIRTSIIGDVLNRFHKYLKSVLKEGEVLVFSDLPEEFRNCIEWDVGVQQLCLQEL